MAVPAFAAFVVLEGVGKVIFGSGDGHHVASHVQYEKSAIGSTPEVAEH
jgi:hypothetical protein